MDFKTEQETFWHGEFGAEYSERNIGKQWIASNLSLFSSILKRTESVKSVIEFGSNIGLNLKALDSLIPDAQLSAIEINPIAVEKLNEWGRVKNIYPQSILEFTPLSHKWDMSLIKGVLIHINPDALQDVYEKLYLSSSRYICIVEYYNPSPVAITYRGHTGRLFKRDFAGEVLEKYPDLKLVDYGFVYRRDRNFPQDDCTWFLLEKS